VDDKAGVISIIEAAEAMLRKGFVHSVLFIMFSGTMKKLVEVVQGQLLNTWQQSKYMQKWCWMKEAKLPKENKRCKKTCGCYWCC